MADEINEAGKLREKIESEQGLWGDMVRDMVYGEGGWDEYANSMNLDAALQKWIDSEPEGWPRPGEVWRHQPSGCRYEIICLGIGCYEATILVAMRYIPREEGKKGRVRYLEVSSFERVVEGVLVFARETERKV